MNLLLTRFIMPVLTGLSLACLVFQGSSALAQPEKPADPPPKPVEKVDSILDDLYGDQDELNRACKQPCQKEKHVLTLFPGTNAYKIQFTGIYITPFTEGTVNGLDTSKRVRIPDNPTLPKEERDNIQSRIDIFVMDGNTWMTASRCKDGCQCAPLFDKKGDYRQDPAQKPTIGMHEVLLHAGTFKQNGKKYLKQYILKAYTLRIPYLAECRGGYCGPEPIF